METEDSNNSRKSHMTLVERKITLRVHIYLYIYIIIYSCLFVVIIYNMTMLNKLRQTSEQNTVCIIHIHLYNIMKYSYYILKYNRNRRLQSTYLRAK